LWLSRPFPDAYADVDSVRSLRRHADSRVEAWLASGALDEDGEAAPDGSVTEHPANLRRNRGKGFDYL
jgi:hypothetical protein